MEKHGPTVNIQRHANLLIKIMANYEKHNPSCLAECGIHKSSHFGKSDPPRGRGTKNLTAFVQVIMSFE